MKANALVVLFALVALTGCTAEEQSKTLTSEKNAISRAQKSADTMADETTRGLKDLKENATKGINNLREGAKNTAASISKETESGAQALETGAKGLEKLSHDAATRAAAVREAVKKFNPDSKTTETTGKTAETTGKPTAK